MMPCQIPYVTLFQLLIIFRLSFSCAAALRHAIRASGAQARYAARHMPQALAEARASAMHAAAR